MRISAGRVITVIALVFGATACSRTPTVQVKFEPLYRAAKAIQASTAVGLSYQQLGELLLTLGTEVSIAADKAEAPEEKALVAAYVSVLEAYKDSHSVWNATIQSNSRVTRDLEPLVAKYKLPASGGTFEDGAIQMIWQSASTRVDNATALYYQRGRK